VLSRRRTTGRFPDPVRELIGEMAAAGVLMQSNIKFNGALVLQLHGDGPVKLAVAEVQSDLTFRATATVVGDIAPDARLEAMLNVHGKGRCAVTLDPKDKLPGQQPYQGVVALHDERHEPLQDLAGVLEHYMLQSEQLDTKLVLAADDNIAAGLLIQRLAVEGGGNLAATPSVDETHKPSHPQRDEDQTDKGSAIHEDYNRIALLAATLTRDELLTLEAEPLLRRLFWEEDVRRFEPLHPRFRCTCSRERVGQMLKGLGRDEIDSIVSERTEVEVGCEFCGQQYRFDAVDVGELFTPQRDQPPSSPIVH
jgi:molecular chaperone Hsp33